MKFQSRRQSKRIRSSRTVANRTHRIRRGNLGSRRMTLENMEDRRMLAVIMATDFNDSTIGGATNIKTNLNWTLNGVDDPGDMAALNAGGSPQAIFDANGFVQDIFIPGLNTGNGNTFWTTDIPITVAAGSGVILEDVTFNAVSVSGGQAENVNRRNDYTVTLFDPSATIVEAVTMADVTAGTTAGQPLVTFDFADVALSDPGSYTLRIQGGDYIAPDETGNHTGLDNLSINGTISTAPAGFSAVDDAATTDEDTPLTVSAPGVLANDVPGGNPLVYEGFQYATAGGDRSESDLFDGQPNDPGDIDATGLSGTWLDNTSVVSTSDTFIQSGSLSFGNLATSGNSIRTDTNLNNDSFFRPISANLAGSTTGEIWFSFLADKLQNNFNAAEGGVVIGNQVVNSSQVQTDDGSTGLAGFAIAPNTNGNNWQAYAWNGSSQSDGGGALTVGIGGGDVHLLIGRIAFDSGAGGTDQFSVFDYDLTSSGGTVIADMTHLNQIGSTIEVDVTQADLDTLSVTRQVNTAYDEIRIGETLADVIPQTPAILAHDPVSAEGAAVTVNADGSFSYDPTGSATLQAMNNGDSVVDTFDYTIIEQGPLLSNARLTAYYPLTATSGLDDVIDDPSHPARDATTEGTGGSFVTDPMRGSVYSTTEDDRLVLASAAEGGQGIDLTTEGFTWSLWVQTDSNQVADAGADVIIGSRTGTWNKVQPTGTERWADIGGYNIDDGLWHHVVLTGTAEPNAEVSLYIDGTLIGSDNTFFNGIQTITDKFELGGTSQFSEDIAGRLSDVSIWKGALTPEQIQALANDTATPLDLNPQIDSATVSVTVDGVTDFTALDDSYGASYTAGALTPLVIPVGSTDLLANDVSTMPITVQSIESTNSGGTVVVSGNATILTDQGASVTVNDDGSFSYDPSGSAAIQALDNSSLIDSFQYTITDGTETSTGSVTINVLVTSPPSPGDIAIFAAGTAGESVSATDLVHDFETEVRRSGSHVLGSNGEDVSLSAGHHLVIYNARFDKDPTGLGTEDRSEIQSNLNLAGQDLAVGWSQGYIRVQNGQNSTITAGGGIINVQNPGDTLQLQSFRTDTDTNDTTRGVDTGIQLIKLDDTWDYLSLAGHDGSATDQAIPNDTSGWTSVDYSQQLEIDSNSFSYTAGTGITLQQAGHYLVFANTYTTGASSREAIIQRLNLGGNEVVGSKTNVYLRGNDINQTTDEGAASIGMILETTAANQILNVEIQQDVGRAGMTIVGERTGITIVKLPDDADYVRLEDLSGDQNLNSAAPVAMNYDDTGSQLELDSIFDHSTTTDPSRVNVTENGDFLFLSSQFDSNDGTQRGFYNQGWQVNGTGGLGTTGQTGQYSRNAGGADQFGNWSGFVTGLQAGDYVESVSVELGNSGTNTADILALQGVSLDSLFVVPLDAVDDNYTASNPIGESGTLDTSAVGAASILDNDTPTGATIIGINGTMSLSGTSAEGATVTVSPDGSFVYDTNGLFESLADGDSLPDSFTYTIDDGNGTTDTATVSLLVSGENDNPVSNNVSIAADEDGAVVVGNFDADDVDSDDDPSSLTYMITSSPAEGAVANNNGTFSFDPGSDFQDLAQGETRVIMFDYTATDSNGGVSNASTIEVTVTGVNDDPTLGTDNATAAADEGQTATNSGTFADVDNGSAVTISASAGMITQDDNLGTWSWSFDSADGPVESQVITITADDGLGGVVTTTFDLIVNNVPPTASVTGPIEALVNSAVAFTIDATDPSMADQTAGFTFDVDWGDGTIETIPPADATHTYTVAGQYTVTVTATDKDNGTSIVAATHVIDITEPLDPVVQVGDDIVVTGTDGSDRIVFSPSGAGFRVRFNNEFYPLDGSVFSVNAGTQLIVNGNEGSDTVIIHGTIGAPAVFDGGAGNDYLAGGTDDDTLIGGIGNDVLLGGEGNNRLEGGEGNDRAEGRSGIDYIFGGAGTDRLNGGAGDDIIDGGSDNDLIHGGLGNDLLAGREGSDTLNGHYGNDILYGGSGADQLFGSNDNDLLFGGLAGDRLRGDNGDDVLVGGTSALESDTEASLDVLLAGGSLLPSVQAAIDAWFASPGETSRMLFEPFADDGDADDISGGAGADTFQSGTNDRLRDVRSGDTLL